MKKPKVSTAGSSAQPRLFVERRLCKTDAQRGCLHEHCRSDHELRSQDTARRREASQTTFIRFDLSSIPADYTKSSPVTN